MCFKTGMDFKTLSYAARHRKCILCDSICVNSRITGLVSDDRKRICSPEGWETGAD